MGDGDLRVLRKLLLAPEQEILQKITQRLDDPDIRARWRTLPAHSPPPAPLASQDEQVKRALLESLKSMVREIVLETLRERPEPERANPEEKASAPKPPRHWLGGVGRLLRRRAETGPVQLEQLYLVRRVDGVLVEQSMREITPADESTEAQLERSRLLSLVMSFMEAVRDVNTLTQYAAQRHLRVENHVLGFHVNDRYLLLSVIHAPGDTLFEAELLHCDTILAEVSQIKHIKAGTRALPAIEATATQKSETP